MTQSIERKPRKENPEDFDRFYFNAKAYDDLHETHRVSRIDEMRSGVGSLAVYAALDQSVLTTNNNYSRGSHEGYDEAIELSLQAARLNLESLSDQESSKPQERIRHWNNRRTFNRFVASHESSRAINQLLGFAVDAKRPNYLRRLTQKDSEGEYVVDNQVLLNFLEWHNHALAGAQEKYDEQHKTQKKLFHDKFTKAIKDGWIPDWVSDRLDDRLQKTVVSVDDGFATNLNSKGVVANASHKVAGGHEVLLAPHYANKSKRLLTHTMTHEFVHVMDGYPGLATYKRGLYKLFKPGATAAAMALNEAVVEHLADSLMTGKAVDVTDPASFKRLGSTFFYYKERALLNTLATMGKRKVDVRLFIAAHFDDGQRFDEDGASPTDRLREAIEEAFPGQDVLNRLSNCQSDAGVYQFTKKLRKKNNGKLKRTKHEVKRVAAIAAIYGATAVASMAVSEAVDQIQGESDHVDISYEEPAEDGWLAPVDSGNSTESSLPAADVTGNYNTRPTSDSVIVHVPSHSSVTQSTPSHR